MLPLLPLFSYKSKFYKEIKIGNYRDFGGKTATAGNRKGVMERKNDLGSCPISDELLSTLMNNLYNGWFCKYRTKMEAATDSDFDALMTEATSMIEQYKQYPLIRNLVVSFIYELDARMHGGYTQASQGKLLRMISGEFG